MTDPAIIDQDDDQPTPALPGKKPNGHDGDPVPAQTFDVSKADDRLADLLDRPHESGGLADRLRFDHERSRWHYLESKKASIWRPDTTGYVFEMLRERLTVWYGQAGSQSVVKELSSLMNLPKKKSVLESFSYRRSVALRGDEWDQDPHLMGAPNGLIDLRSGKLITAARPELLISRSVRVPYDPKSDPARDCPLFLTFLSEITAGDLEKANYLLRIFGYAMFGLQTEQKFWLFTGQGNNGKGTLTKVVAHVLGDYAASPASTLYMRSKNGSPPSSAPRADLLGLQGLRYTPLSEPEGGAFNDELLKAHTGDDPIHARNLHERHEYEFRPTHTIIVSTNKPPAVEDVGKSMQRRVRVVPFTESFDGPRMDKELETKLRAESVGILAVLVKMAGLWYDQGLEEPESVSSASRSYIEDNDPLSEFVHARCVVEPDASTGARPLYDAYQDWAARDEHRRPMSMAEFGTSISRRFQKVKGRQFNTYRGLRLRSSVEEPSTDLKDQSVSIDV